MHLLYPSDPFDKKRPDEQYAEEYEAVMTAGLRTVLFSFEDFEAGLFKTSASLTPGDSILVLRSDGVLRVVELGDGQVSDRKEWPAERFAWMLSRAG